MYVFSVQNLHIYIDEQSDVRKKLHFKKEETLWIHELYIFLEMSKCDIGYIKKH